MKKGVLLFLCFFMAGYSVWGGDLDKKKQKVKTALSMDKGFLVFGALPNSSGNMDGYAAGQFFYSKKLLSFIEVETTTVKKDKQVFDRSAVVLEDTWLDTSIDYEQRITVSADLFKYRFINSMDSNTTFRVSATPFFAMDYNYFEARAVIINGTNSYVSDEQQKFVFFQAHGKAEFQYSRKNRFSVQVYGSAGMTFGIRKSDFILLDTFSTNNYFRNNSDDSTFITPGWSVGGKVYYNFGPFSLQVEGSFVRSQGDSKVVLWDSDSQSYGRFEEEFRFTSWHLRVELGLNLFKINGAIPTLFYSVGRTAFEVQADDGYGGVVWDNLIARYDDAGSEISLVHKFGILMRF